ncbi:transposase [Streptomyces sp. JV186]|uniref:transposase n=1 Tax=Streptomyces sp. JV186 TaxID=858639 RepID=UPI003FA72A40
MVQVSRASRQPCDNNAESEVTRSCYELLGRRRWVIERTMSWLTGYRRLNHRYERQPRNYLAFLGLAAAL